MGKSKKVADGTSRIFVNMLRPRDPKVSLQIAKDFLAGGTPNLDQGLYSKTECKALWEAQEDGKGVFPNLYDPVIMQLGKARGALFGVSGQKKNAKPKDWPAKFGDHMPGDKLDDGRLMHLEDIHKDAYLAPEALVTVGNHEYVVGTTGEDGQAAPYLVEASKTGNYAANLRVTSRLGYVEMTTESGQKVTKTEFATLVGQINGGPILVKLEDGTEIPHLPNQVITWGHLSQDDKVLTPSQIRKLSDPKGVIFTPLKERWIGRAFDQNEFWREVQKVMKAADTKVTYADDKGNETTMTLMERYESRPARSEDKDRQMETKDSAWNNISTVQTRNSPKSMCCFGWRSAQLGKPIAKTYSDDGKTVLVFPILGGYTTTGLVKTKWDVNRSMKEAAAAAKPAKAPKAAKEPKAPKAPKTPKVKAEKAPKAPKTPKPKAAKPKKDKAQAVPVSETATDAAPEAPAETPEVTADLAADALGIPVDEVTTPS